MSIYKSVNDDDYFKLVLKIALTTGQRLGDMLEFKFDNVTTGQLIIKQYKTEKDLILPLSLKSPLLEQTLGEIIDECRLNNSSGFILRNAHEQVLTESYVRIKWIKWCRECATERPFHDIRILAKTLYESVGIKV
jgi:integrase